MRSFARRLLISPRRSSQFPDFLAVQAMIAFIDDHRQAYGVEPVCRVLPIAPRRLIAPISPGEPIPPVCPTGFAETPI